QFHPKTSKNCSVFMSGRRTGKGVGARSDFEPCWPAFVNTTKNRGRQPFSVQRPLRSDRLSQREAIGADGIVAPEGAPVVRIRAGKIGIKQRDPARRLDRLQRYRPVAAEHGAAQTEGVEGDVEIGMQVGG